VAEALDRALPVSRLTKISFPCLQNYQAHYVSNSHVNGERSIAPRLLGKRRRGVYATIEQRRITERRYMGNGDAVACSCRASRGQDCEHEGRAHSPQSLPRLLLVVLRHFCSRRLFTLTPEVFRAAPGANAVPVPWRSPARPRRLPLVSGIPMHME
jgi:hypothetical protein